MRLWMKSSSKMGTKFSSDSQKISTCDNLSVPISLRTCSLLLELASMVCPDSLQLCTNALHTGSTMWLQASQISHLTIQIIVYVLCWISWRLLTKEVCLRAEPLANTSREGGWNLGSQRLDYSSLLGKMQDAIRRWDTTEWIIQRLLHTFSVWMYVFAQCLSLLGSQFPHTDKETLHSSQGRAPAALVG